ncbi:NADH dehydrogenase subunit 6, partial (mitochondrion) [Neolecta irregularis DAH-3]
MITSKNPVISVLYLIALFINVAGYLILLGIHFIGLAYLIVYVGAIAILFIFVIMLMNIKLSELYTKDNTNSFPLGLVVGLSFLYPIYNQIVKTIGSSVSAFIDNNKNEEGGG